VLPYDFKFGSEWVTLAPQLDNGQPGEFSTLINLGSIDRSNEKFFYVKITRDASHMIASVDPYRFTLLLLND
jgi:hypothetical protein